MGALSTGNAVTKVQKSHRSNDPVLKYILDNSLRLHPVQKELAEVSTGIIASLPYFARKSSIYHHCQLKTASLS